MLRYELHLGLVFECSHRVTLGTAVQQWGTNVGCY